MKNKIAFISGKGGVGKSTLSFAFANVLADSGMKVLIVDLDIGLGTQDIFLNFTNKVLYNWNDFLLNRCSFEDIILKGKIDLLSAPSGIDLLNADKFDSVIENIQGIYDLIIFDSPAGISTGFDIACKFADVIFAISTPDIVCTQKVATAVRSAKKINEDAEIRLIINRFDSKKIMKSAVKDIDEIIDITKAQLIGVVPENKKFSAEVQDGAGKITSRKVKGALNRILMRLKGENVILKL